MQMDFILNLIYTKLSDAVDEVKTNYERDTDLRNELIEKCHSKLCNTNPRVKVDKISWSKLNNDEKLKLKLESQTGTFFNCLDPNYQSSSPSNIEIGPVKVELQEMSYNESRDDFAGQPDPERHIDMDRRMTNDDQDLQYYCDECRKQFTCRGNYNRHRRNFHLKIRFSCKKCGKTFARKDTLNNHLRVAHFKQGYTCQNCQGIFSPRNRYVRHLKSCLKTSGNVVLPTANIYILDDTKLKSILENPILLSKEGEADADEFVGQEVTPSHFQQVDEDTNLLKTADICRPPILKSQSELSNQDLGRIIMEEHNYAQKSLCRCVSETSTVRCSICRYWTNDKDEEKTRAMNIKIPVHDIIHMPSEQLAEIQSKSKLSLAQRSLIRSIRRRGKNKVRYARLEIERIIAQYCRQRKLEEISQSYEDIQRMLAKKQILAKEQECLIARRAELKERYSFLHKTIFDALKDPDGTAYNPLEYSLQHDADGKVILLPL